MKHSVIDVIKVKLYRKIRLAAAAAMLCVDAAGEQAAAAAQRHTCADGWSDRGRLGVSGMNITC